MSTDRSPSLSASIVPATSGGGGGSSSAAPAAPSAPGGPVKRIKALKPAMTGNARQHVSKHFDIVLAVDFHWTTIPVPPSFGIIPLPLPHPFIGMVFDPMDYLHFDIPIPSFLQEKVGAKSIPMGGSIYVHGRHKATTTTSVMGVLLPFRHISSIPGLYFIVNIPGSPHEGEVYWGSTTVSAQGSELSGSDPQQVLTCWCPPMGLKMLPTMPNKIKKNPLAYFAFYNDVLSMYVQINTGGPVLVGGAFAPHNYTAAEMLMRFAGMALVKGLGKLGGALSKRALTGVNKVLKRAFGTYNPLSKKLCKFGFEPVNFVTGAMFFEWTDFELPGGATLQWNNAWRSDRPYCGMLGNGVYNSYDLYILPDEAAGIAGFNHPSENMVMPLPYIYPGSGMHYDRSQQVAQERPDADTWILLLGQDVYTYKLRKEPAYGAIFRIKEIRYANGARLDFQYQADTGLLALVADDAGRRLELAPNADHTKVEAVYYRYKNINDLMVRYEYDEHDNLVRVFDPAGKSIDFEYDAQNRVVKRTNRNHISYFWEYDAEGRVIHTGGANGFQEGRLEYFPSLGYNKVHYHNGKTELYFYDENDLVYKEVDALGGETWYQYTRYNERKMIASPEGRMTGYEYDERGNVVTYYNPEGEAYTYAYNTLNQITERIEPSGFKETWTYDEAGLLQEHNLNDENKTTYYYEAGTRLPASCTDTQGRAVDWQYNELGLLVSERDSSGIQRSWQYDNYGRMILFSPEPMKIISWQRDDMGRVVRYKDIGQDVISLAYDAYELPVYASDGKEEWTLEYTPMGSLSKQVRRNLRRVGDIQTLLFSYDAYDNLRAIRNEKGEHYTFVRNANDEIIEEKGFDGIHKQYIRNRDGFIIKTLLPGGKQVYHDYDLSGRLTYSKYDDGYWEAFRYGRSGLLESAENPASSIAYKRNARGQVIQEIQGEHTINYSYDALGNQVALNSSLGANQQQEYNALGFQTLIRADVGGQQWSAAIKRDVEGRELHRNMSGGIAATFDYDHEGRPVSQKVQVRTGSALHKQYSWHSNSKLASCLNLLTGGKVNYSYDSSGNLAAALYDNKDINYKNPDETGNLFRTPNRSDRVYSKGGRLLKDDSWYYRYDEAGNLVHKSKRNINNLAPVSGQGPTGENTPRQWAWATTDALFDNGESQVQPLAEAPPGAPEWHNGDWLYTWNDIGTLQSVKDPQGQTTRFEYDALGRRTAKITGDTLHRYIWDDNVLLHEWSYPLQDRPQLVIDENGALRYNHAEPITPGLVTWIYDQQSFSPCAKLIDGQQYSIVNDYLGTPVQAFDNQGKKVWECELDIYGKVRKITGDPGFIPFRYQGQYEDAETGLYYNRHRYYDPEAGDYISKDPVGLLGGLALYAYVKDTNTWLDILGLAGSGGAYLFGFESGDMYIGKGSADRMQQSISTRTKQVGNSPLLGKAHVDTGGNNELGKMVEYKAMKDAGFEPGRAGVPDKYLNSHMSGKSAWEDPKNKHLQTEATELAKKLRGDYEADVKVRAEAKAKVDYK
ncbi:RHS repeat-associated protein [Taibaiella chishuiensis]|uniref:RHS repeat-associated protein n=2 Tax=Taibaiella chishuiensis TaxID=1434707 RepID=A0A2P8CVU3_9BACT|nr:RHS repeat-associated protein [Taibaiella chishuiensis]